MPRAALLTLVLALAAPGQSTLESRANELIAAGKHSEAAALLREAIDAADDESASSRVIVLFSRLATCHRRAGHHELELEVLEECLEEIEGASLTADTRAVYAVNATVDTARCLGRLGRLRSSLRRAEEAVELAESAASEPLLVKAWNELGLSRQKLGRLPEALDALRRARDLFASLAPNSPHVASITVNICQVRTEFGQTEAALNRLLELDQSLREAGRSLRGGAWIVPHRIGLLHHDLGDDVKALSFHDRALEELESAGRAETPLHASMILDGTYSARRLGQFRRSLADSERALTMLRKRFPGDHHHIARALHCRASSRLGRLRAGRREKVEDILADLEAALAISRRLGDHHLPSALVALGRFCLGELEDLDRAESLMREAVDHAEAMRARAFSLGAVERADYFRRVRQGRDLDPYEGLARVMVARERIADAVGFLERSRARSTLDKLRLSMSDPIEAMRRRAAQLDDRERVAELDAEERRLAEAERELRELRRAAAADRRPAAEMKPALERLESATGRPGESPVGAARPAAMQEIRGVLGANECLLFYDVRPGSSQLYVVSPANGPCGVYELRDEKGQPATQASLGTKVQAYRNGIVREGYSGGRRGLDGFEQTSPIKLGHALFRALMPEDAWKRISGCSLVYIVPHGPLKTLPFEALVVEPREDAARSRYWIDAGPPVTYAASGSLFVWASDRRRDQAASGPRGDLVVLAAPDFHPPEIDPDTIPPGRTVTRVRTGGSAAHAGVRAGDVVTHAGDEEVGKAPAKNLGSTAAARLKVWRLGRSLELELPAGERRWDLAEGSARETLMSLAAASRRAEARPIPPLPGTLTEARRIAAIVREKSAGKVEVRPLFGVEAHEAHLHAHAGNARILHLATHQVPDPESRWGAGRLALTGSHAPTKDDDGFLDLDDLLLRWSGRLDRCELVVLSACRSRIGRDRFDEGLFAIPWGFQAAGCPSIVASLWPIDDKVTAELMTAFYARAGRGGVPDAAALRAAAREVRKTSPRPFHWAPFVWIGAPR